MVGISAYRDNSGRRVPCLRTEDGVFAIAEDWPEVLARMADRAEVPATPTKRLSGDIVTCAPLPEGRMIYAIGVNYADHVQAGFEVMRDMGFRDPVAAPPRPAFFCKPPDPCLAAPGACIAPPEGCTSFDMEIELCAVIGREGKALRADAALDHVAGYAIALDMSARDFQLLPGTLFGIDLFSGKVFDGACPVGPALCPAGDIADPGALALRAAVNGEVWQEGNTAGMTLSLPGIIAALSRLVTLYPGDAILTGTPAGTGFETGRSLRPEDVISARIDGLGELSVRIGASSGAKTA